MLPKKLLIIMMFFKILITNRSTKIRHLRTFEDQSSELLICQINSTLRFMSICVCMFAYLFICMFVCLSVWVGVRIGGCLDIYLYACLSVFLCVRKGGCLDIYLYVGMLVSLQVHIYHLCLHISIMC